MEINKKALFLGPFAIAFFLSIALLVLALVYSLIAIAFGPGFILDSVPTITNGCIYTAKIILTIGSIASCLWQQLIKDRFGE
jgi:hypothetical protein